MINKSIIEEWVQLPKGNEMTIMTSVALMQKYVPIRLINTADNKLVYQVKLKDIYNSPMELEELIQLRNGGWDLDEANEMLVKYI